MGFLPDDFKAEKVQDFEGSGEFEVMKGKAIGVLEKIEHTVGEWPSGDVKDQVELRWRIKEKIEGNCFPNRVTFRKYSMIDTEYNGKVTPAAKHRSNLVNDLSTAGFDVDLSSDEAVYESMGSAKGVEANLSLREFPKGKQFTQVVEKFSVKKAGSSSKAVVAEEVVPF